MRQLLFTVLVIAFLASMLPVLYPGTILGALGMPLNVFVAEAIREMFRVRSEALLMAGEGQNYMLTLQGVLLLYLPALGVMLLALRGR